MRSRRSSNACSVSFGTLCVLCVAAVIPSRAAAQEPAPKPPAAASSGIAGIALVGPITPVERPGVPNARPLPGAIVTVQPENGGDEIARGTADEKGRFKVPLIPGVYRIVPLPPKPGSVLPRGAPQQVRVREGAFTRVTVRYDSGIR